MREKDEKGKLIRWVKIPWVSFCEYNADVGIAIKLNDLLKPFLLQLQKHYTQIVLEDILAMKSVYAIRIFEMLQSKVMSNLLPKEGVHIIIPVQEIRECCNCVDKLKQFAHFRSKVLDTAKSEIERVTPYTLDYTYVKQGRTVVAIEFHMNVCYHIVRSHG